MNLWSYFRWLVDFIAERERYRARRELMAEWGMEWEEGEVVG